MWEQLQQNPYPDPEIDMTSLIQSMALDDYAEAVAVMKHRGFRSEREVRYLIAQPAESAVHLRGPSFGRLDSTPYIVVTGSPADIPSDPREWPHYQDPAKPLPLPVVTVRLGPDLKSKALRQHVRHMLIEWGYPAVTVVRSKSTIR